MIRASALTLVALAALLPLIAQEGSLAGPVSGLVFDRHARALRPMLGVPGASHLGAALLADTDLAAASPSGASVLAWHQDRLILARPESGELRFRVLADESARPAWIAWSRASSPAAAAVLGEDRRLALWRNLAGEPERLDLPLPDGAVRSIAVSLSGDAVFVAIEDQTHGGIWRLEPDHPRLVARLPRPAALAAGPDDRLYFADLDRQEIFAMRAREEGTDLALLAGPAHGIEDPAALAVSRDGKTLLIAEARPRRIRFWNLAAFAMTGELALAFEPNRLEPLAGGSLFLLNERRRAEDVLHVLDHGLEPAVWFVPAGETPAPSVED
jgi:hypothetical protein